MNTKIQSIASTALTIIMALALSLTSTIASDDIRINYNFDIDIHNRTDLVGPAGGAGETWNQSMQGTHNAQGGFGDTNVLNSAGATTTIDWSLKRSDDGALFKWNSSDPATLSMLKRGIFSNSPLTLTLTLSDLNPAKIYDLYITGYGGTTNPWTETTNYKNQTTHSTNNTTKTSGQQQMLQTGETANWVRNDNYVLFKGIVPNSLGSIAIDSAKISSYGFWSGFQLIERTPVPILITDFSYNGTDGSSEVSITGDPSTRYKLIEADDLNFADPNQDPIPLTGATVGSLNEGGVMTDTNGKATTQFNLGTGKEATFIRAESYPKGLGPELELMAAVRGGYARKIVIIGTSLSTVQYGNWPSLLEAWLKSEAPDPSKITVVNLAISGSHSQNGGINQLTNVKAQNPDTVFMEFSMNDAYTPYNISLQQSKDNHNTIINDLKASNPDIEIIVQTMTNPTRGHLTIRPNIASYYQAARDVAAAQELLLIDHYPNWLTLFNTDEATWNTYVPDGIHPVNTGYQNVLLPKLKQALEAPALAP